ncbi:MAG: alpha/beta fold hydrolase [Pseudomonadales bacterium]|nr:alpha/beta fold hydrolase [Pseudomonadales bacterium]
MSGNQLVNQWRVHGRELRVEGANTWIWNMGQGEAVVCVHGVPSSGFLYRKVLPELAILGLQGITLDLPGLGLADRPLNFDYSWSGLAQWYVQALNAAGIDRFHLVVHDIGGPIGFDVIRRIPERILSLTVLNTMIDVSEFHRSWSMEPFAWPVAGRLWLQSAKTPLFFVLMRMQGMHKVSLEEAGAYAELLLGQDGGQAFLQIMKNFERTPRFEAGIKSALSARQFPAQVIWGQDDPMLRDTTYAPSLLKALDLDSYTKVRGKHFVQEDAYLEIAQAIATLTTHVTQA